MKTQWTMEQANEWYSRLGWLRGCNFIGSDCANRLDMFQSYKADEKLKTAERELALCQKIGFNTVRIWANFDVYYAEPEEYMEIFERYISLCAKYGQKVMVVLTHEEDLPRGEKFEPKPMGEQNYALGYHQGRAPLTPERKAMRAMHYMEYPELYDRYLEMIVRTVRKYARDERIFCWNIYNEPGIALGDLRAEKILRKIFEVVRAEDPIQPLCADIWKSLAGKRISSEVEKVALELSDVISFHSYQPFPEIVESLQFLRSFGRPIFQTEWLHRINHNNVAEMYPLLYLTNVANYCWGFVLGKTQTNEPWDVMWRQLDEGEDHGYDFTKWQHDLFRPNLRPYDPREIALIEKFNRLAKEEGR